MASVALMIGGAIVNALAFSGSQYLFSGDTDAERKRHDEAVERLQAAQSAWSQQRTMRLEFLNDESHREQHAVRTFQDIDQAMQEYALVTGKKLDPLDPEPKLEDYFVPSDIQKDREIAFIVLGMAVTGFVAYKFL
jgi:hypothetical protein